MVNVLKVLRKSNGWSQADLAQKLNVTRGMVSTIENGYHPSKKLQEELESIFNRPFESLVEEVKV